MWPGLPATTHALPLWLRCCMRGWHQRPARQPGMIARRQHRPPATRPAPAGAWQPAQRLHLHLQSVQPCNSSQALQEQFLKRCCHGRTGLEAEQGARLACGLPCERAHCQRLLFCAQCLGLVCTSRARILVAWLVCDVGQGVILSPCPATLHAVMYAAPLRTREDLVSGGAGSLCAYRQQQQHKGVDSQGLVFEIPHSTLRAGWHSAWLALNLSEQQPIELRCRPILRSYTVVIESGERF